jgi:hypothetical protein
MVRFRPFILFRCESASAYELAFRWMGLSIRAYHVDAISVGMGT